MSSQPAIKSGPTVTVKLPTWSGYFLQLALCVLVASIIIALRDYRGTSRYTFLTLVTAVWAPSLFAIVRWTIAFRGLARGRQSNSARKWAEYLTDPLSMLSAFIGAIVLVVFTLTATKLFTHNFGARLWLRLMPSVMVLAYTTLLHYGRRAYRQHS